MSSITFNVKPYRQDNTTEAIDNSLGSHCKYKKGQPFYPVKNVFRVLFMR
jgi:hypothetical protein